MAGEQGGVTGRVRRSSAPYLLILPGLLFLTVFFAVPLMTMFSVSLQEGTFEGGYSFAWKWANYTSQISQYSEHIVRSVVAAAIVTLITILLSYPMMYWIATRGGRRKTLYLLLLLLPYFVPFLIRTISWKFVLADNGILFGTLKDLGVLYDGFRILDTREAAIAGMVYNFFPFMALPLYVALERLDPSLIDAANDLYSNRFQAFWRVTFPLSMPGVLAGTLLTFIPAVGDFIDAELLGGSGFRMIGNVIDAKFAESFDYPEGAALSFVLIAALLVGVIAYTRAVGTEELTG
jgi:spermidine/putrescine transport system permease protein